MSINFPDSPTTGQIYTPLGGASYRWTGSFWTTQGAGGSGGATAASSVSNVPAGNIASTNVQAALNELDTEKVAKAGDTMSGTLNIVNSPNGGGLWIDQVSTAGIWSAVSFRVAGAMKARIGSAGANLIAGSSNNDDLCIRAENKSILLSANGGTSAAVIVDPSNLVSMSGPLNVAKSVSSGVGTFNVGDDANAATGGQNGYKVTIYTDGNVYSDYKTIAGGTVYFRTGAGAQTGASINFLTVNSTTGDVSFSATLTAGSTISTGGIFLSGKAGSGTGGNYRCYSDDGAARWLMGVLGAVGAKDFSIFDITVGIARLSFDALSAAARFTAHVFPTADATYQDGDTTLRWYAFYGYVGTIVTSDERVKTNIKPLKGALDIANNIDVCSFDLWDGNFEKGKLKKGKKTHHTFGVKAKQLRAALKGYDGVVFGEDKKQLLGTAESKIGVLALAAVKELAAEVAKLKEKK